MLGFGRALGETMAVTMVIGNNPQVSVSLFAPQYTMAAVIANEFTEAADELYLHALVEIGLVLFIITLIVNSLSRLLIWSMAAAASTTAAAAAAAAEPAAGMTLTRCRKAAVVGCSSRSARPSVLLALVPLAFILFFVVCQGIQALNLDFFTHMPTAGRRSRRRHGQRHRRHADRHRAGRR